MQLTHLTKMSFSGHESFPLRLGWLPKVAHWLPQKPDLFSHPEATTLLGVGKNMVYAMRHWGEVFGMVEQGRERGEYQLTPLAEKLLHLEDGWDPYLEDPGTLWLLHGQLLLHPERATLAHLLFTQYGAGRFDKGAVLHWVERGLREVPQVRATSSSLERDFDVLMRTYLPAPAGRGGYGEEAFDSPLIPLGLLRRLERGQYEFVRGEQPGLPLEVLGSMLVQFWQRTARAQNTLSFERLMFDPGSPGAAFKLTEGAMIARLENLSHQMDLRYDDTAGVRVVSRAAPWPETTALDLLETYYRPAPRSHNPVGVQA